MKTHFTTNAEFRMIRCEMFGNDYLNVVQAEMHYEQWDSNTSIRIEQGNIGSASAGAKITRLTNEHHLHTSIFHKTANIDREHDPR